MIIDIIYIIIPGLQKKNYKKKKKCEKNPRS